MGWYVFVLIAGAGMFVLNTEKFGYIVKPELFHTAEEYTNHFVNFKLKTLGKGSLELIHVQVHFRVFVCVNVCVLVNHPPVLMSQYLSQPPVTTDTVGVDKVRVHIEMDELNRLARPGVRPAMGAV